MPCHNLAENFNNYFEIRYADNDALLKEVYKIRYDVFCDELKLEENCPQDVEKDEFDVYAHHFLLKHRTSGKYAGTVRFVIPPGDIEGPALPFEKYCADAFDTRIVDPSVLPQGSYGEVSRLAVPARFRKRAGERGKPYIVDSPRNAEDKENKRLFPYISVGLYLVCAALFVEKKLDYAFVMAEPRLARSMARIGICFDQAGDVVDYHGMRAPFYITQEMLASGLKPEVAELFAHILKEVRRQVGGGAGAHKKAS